MSEDMTFLPKRDLLTLEEIDRVRQRLRHARGTRKLR
jgi:molybdenum cofactor biosynthesis enzyme MoaA